MTVTIDKFRMKKLFKYLGFSVLTLVALGALAWFFYLKPPPPPISDEDRDKLGIMPIPAELEFGKDKFLIDQDLGISYSDPPGEKLTKAVDRFLKKLERSTQMSFDGAQSKKLFIRILEPSKKEPDAKEMSSYELTVRKDRINITAYSETGAFYALETLLQLLEDSGGTWIIPEVEIKDQPRYQWRGMMIDVSRHWIPKEVILRNLEAMATLKMNVFHWHLSDYQGFRVESKLFPKLHGLGSNGNYYTQEEIREIVEFAADRSIRVVPEFDMPGHATSWLAGYPEFGSAPGPYKVDTIALGVFRPVLDPTNEAFYEFLDQFIGEMSDLFPDPYFHIGGDEVMAKDWEENEDIQSFMKKHEIRDSHELQAYFNIKLQKILSDHNKIMLGWDEIQHPELPKDGVAVQSWRSHKSLWDAVKNGRKAILSTGYYLDHKKSAEKHYKIDPEVIKGAVTIDIDSTNWSSWKTKIVFGEDGIDGNIYTFGEGEDIKIILDFMENMSSISEVETSGNTLRFTNETDFGEMKAVIAIEGDSLKGTSSLSLFDLEMKGVRSGGSDFSNGLPLPEFKKIEPLSEEEAANILGGEACMWTEMVDSMTVESRIWPRAAAIAEKLWSPKELTNDVGDMYRRLIVIDSVLDSNGLKHRSYQKDILAATIDKELESPVLQFVNLLNEGPFLNRLSLYTPTLYTYTPLNRIVDLAPPESLEGYKFNALVRQWQNSKDPKLKKEIVRYLKKWDQNHQLLLPLCESDERLREALPHLKNLNQLTDLALNKFNEASNGSDPESIRKVLVESKKDHGGTFLSVAEGFETLLLSEMN